MRKGLIVLVPFPFTDLTGQKVRPALVLAVSRGEDCVVAFVSSIPKKRCIFDIVVRPTRANGLKVSSTIKVDKIATLQKNIVLGSLGTLESNILVEVDKKLKQLFRL